MSRLYTEEEKAGMLRMRAEGKSNREIGERYVTGEVTARAKGDIVRKVMARMHAPPPPPPPQKREEAKAKPEKKAKADAPVEAPDRLARIHDEFDAKVPERRASRPAWAGPAPLRIMPKDFQPRYFNPPKE